MRIFRNLWIKPVNMRQMWGHVVGCGGMWQPEPLQPKSLYVQSVDRVEAGCGGIWQGVGASGSEVVVGGQPTA